MKICIASKHGDWSAAKSGKGFFVQRLVTALGKLGAEVTADTDKKVDIALHVGHIRYKSRARANVLRIGPARVSKHEDYEKLNAKRKKSVKLADAVVFQSEYSRKVNHAFVCKPKCPETVIHNGVDYEWYDNVITARDLGKGHIFVASTRKWIAQKRLKDIVLSFNMACIPESKLFILGNALDQDKKYKGDNVTYVGECDQVTIASYLKAASTFVHVVHLDACPNSVAEAVGAGAPVLCTNQGGTAEMLEGWNYISIQDKKFKFKPIDLGKPPRLDRVILANAMIMSADQNWKPAVRPDRLDIGYVANDYLNFFEEVLGG